MPKVRRLEAGGFAGRAGLSLVNWAVGGLGCELALLCFNDGVMFVVLVVFAFGGLVIDLVAEDTIALIFETGHMKT